MGSYHRIGIIQRKLDAGTTGKALLGILLALLVLLSACPLQAGFVDHLNDPDDIGMAKVPRFGHSRLLVVPVNFDTSRRPKLSMTRLRRFFANTKEGFTFHHYFHVNSLGRFDVETELVEPVNFPDCPFLPHQQERCSLKRGDATAVIPAIGVVHRIFADLDERGTDFRRYDLNGPKGLPDGYIDGVLLVTNMDRFGIAFPFGILHPDLAVTLDGVTITMVAISAGKKATYLSIHEFGHLLGLADQYDEQRNTYGLQFSAMGDWHYDKSAMLLDGFSRYQLGWADPVEVSGLLADEAIEPAAAGGKLYKLGRGREFFLVENRAAIGPFDRWFSQAGLAIYHVNLDAMPLSARYGWLHTVPFCPNCSVWRPLVMNVQADGRFDIQFRRKKKEPADLFQSGDAFFNTPKTFPLHATNLEQNSHRYNGNATGIYVTDIDSDSRAPTIRATLQAPRLKNPCKNLHCPPKTSCTAGRCLERKEEAESWPWDEPDIQGKDSPEDSTTDLHLQKISSKNPLSSLDVPQARLPLGGCMSFEDIDWRPVSIILLVLWLLLRGPLRRAYERRLRKKGSLGDDENLKGRF